MRDHALLVITKFKVKQRNKYKLHPGCCFRKLLCSTVRDAPKLAYAVIISLLCIIGVDCGSPAGANESSEPMRIEGTV